MTEIPGSKSKRTFLAEKFEGLGINIAGKSVPVTVIVAVIHFANGKLVWDKCNDPEHCYYRVYCNGEQIASTVAEYIHTDLNGQFQVYSVDKYGNCIVK